jgi:hypothetical protein
MDGPDVSQGIYVCVAVVAKKSIDTPASAGLKAVGQEAIELTNSICEDFVFSRES